ncbi:PilZ domain-containing protein [Legionella impletisoli]|uniref:Type 4 fimbrial biogenesis protein PilZ n=1 Tax=Legionella impletisoli TaxID=343510 RepID=A0A917JXK6_9GAMM|nr:PilZ domain-containing protein [Legionella impletisoli]GGI91267.1 type 4 fimbrial biogenesis protein PilZ [Legionella impletisoli]
MNDMVDLIECNFSDEHALYLAYMPFIKGGGLFIRTKKAYELGGEITLSVQLPEESETYLVEGKIAWLTPKEAQGNKPVGIGVQLSGKNGLNLCTKIETILAGKLKSTEGTDTI